VDTPEPLEFSASVDRVLSLMKNKGMKTEKIFFTAHSLGGIFTAQYLNDHPEVAQGVVFMGTFIERKRFSLTDDGLYENTFKTPSLTLAGEMDGLARIVRMAEGHYK